MSDLSPRVSVITRTRDRHVFLRRAITSLQRQTFTAWQHVIVNDGGVAEQVMSVVHAARHRAEVIHHPSPRGMEAASNSGVRVARGELTIFLDDDDTWDPDCLARLVSARHAAGSTARASVCQSVEVREEFQADQIREISRSVWNERLVAVSLDALVIRNQFTNNAFLVDTEVIREFGGFDEQLEVYGDWDFNLRFFCSYDACVVSEPLANYHLRSSGGDASLNSFVRRPAVAELARARLLRLWLTALDGRRPAVGQLIAMGPQLERQAQMTSRFDKLMNAVHQLRRRQPLAFLERTLLR